MCFIKPLRVTKVKGNTAILENGIKAYCDKKIDDIKPNDEVLVFGNLIIEKIKDSNNE